MEDPREYTREYLNTLTVDRLKQILIDQRKTRAVSSPYYKEEYINRILDVRIPPGYRYNSRGELTNPALFVGSDSFHARDLFPKKDTRTKSEFPIILKCNSIPIFSDPGREDREYREGLSSLEDLD